MCFRNSLSVIDLINKAKELSLEILKNKSLASFTSFKIGGEAEYLIEITDSKMLEKAYNFGVQNDLDVTVLGGGSNVLISDNGLKGLVIINRSRNIEILSNHTQTGISEEESQKYDIWATPRHADAPKEDFYTFSDLDYLETGQRIKVKLDSGVLLPYAISYLLKNNITGLQWFAGIPGTLGGALYNNIHGGSHHLSDYFVEATVIVDGQIKTLKARDFNFNYDQSILRDNPKIVVLDVTLSLFDNFEVQKASYVASEWTKRKRIQPKVSAGCIFKNLTSKQVEIAKSPTPSMGYIIDQVLDLKGFEIGGAQISTNHAAFIINNLDPCASSGDVLEIIRKIKSEVFNKFGFDLDLEINLLGFTNQELVGIKY
jgi:UDP-N-acetylmuramate dehydrogenase